MNVYLLSKFNNYINRVVKKYDNIEDYIPYAIKVENSGVCYASMNFNPNDGINTSLLIGRGEWIDIPDYCIVQDPESAEIVSRWFVLECKRTRGGQYSITLYRDSVADYFDYIKHSPCFIEKATLNSNNPLIFNSENMSFNQIKTSETLLKDKSGCPWIIGYYAKNTPAEYLQGPINRNLLDDNYDILIDTSFDSWKFNATQDYFYLKPENFEYLIYGNHQTTSTGFQAQNGYLALNKDGTFSDYRYSKGNYTLDFNFNVFKAAEQIGSQISEQENIVYSEALAYIPSDKNTTEEDTMQFLNLQGKVIKDSLGNYYQITLNPKDNEVTYIDVTAGSLFNRLSTIVINSQQITGTPDAKSFKIRINSQRYTMTATRLLGLESKWDLSQTKLVTEDAPYNIFAIPLGEVNLKNSNNEIICTSNYDDGMATANSIISVMQAAATGGYLYDIQLLPYCPVYLAEEQEIITKSASEYGLITDSNDSNIGFILNVSKARFSKNIYLKEPIVITDVKVQSECDLYKLCSPNWASEFSFNAAKNGGVEYFNVDCEYKPYTPYIHVNPNFKNLYGRDFDDARGLILGGDFSLSQISEAWQQYQINNKNFQNIFDRQIQNLEIKNNASRIQNIAGIIGGTISGAAGGAISATAIPGGATIGAVAGGIASAAGGVADYYLNEQLRNESIDFTKDNFGYQLGNIQALPYTLTKVSAFNNNNKIFPLLEYYTCTDVEKEALRNKLKYNGMTVMAIGTINEFAPEITNVGQQYIKGKIIRINDMEEEFHMANKLVAEINKGVYI